DLLEALGGDIAAIAAHKAGVIKPGVPVAVGLQLETADDVLMARAAALGAPYRRLRAAAAPGAAIELGAGGRKPTLPAPRRLAGPHQVWNAALAAFAMLSWRDLDDAALAAGIANARRPGRLQKLEDGALSAIVRASGGEAWVDGGHNMEAARWLRYALDLMQEAKSMTNIAIVGLRARKEGPRFVEELSPGVARFIFVPLEGDAHFAPEELAAHARALN